MISTPALTRTDRAAEASSRASHEPVTYFVGQGVGLVDAVKSATDVVQDFRSEFADACEQFTRTVESP